MQSNNYGASPGSWGHWSLVLGLTSDLLPVVSNPGAKISPKSALSALGKVPSVYYNGLAGGIKNWTSKQSTPSEIAKWSTDSRLGICLQTRTVRALDGDITDAGLAARIHTEIDNFLGFKLPCRSRANSPKFLLAFTLLGEYRKRTIKTEHGIIEFLGTGNQCVIDSTHPSGARYTWGPSLPDTIPTLTPEQFEALWAHLVALFAIETPTISTAPSRALKLSEALKNDPVITALIDRHSILSPKQDGGLCIVCPHASQHSVNTDDSSTVYYPAHTGGFERGNFICLHASCAGRTQNDFLTALGFNGSEDYEVIPKEGIDVPESGTPRYIFESLPEAISRPPPEFIIKGLLPQAELAIIYGASRSGKSFFALDLAFAVARGVPWRSLKVRQLGVAYVAAEGAAGFRLRLKAYTTHHNLDPASIPFSVLDAAPSLLKAPDMSDLIHAVGALGPVGLIFLDTLARVTVGGDENSAQDMGRALAACQHLHRATGALVVLIHHSGKDSSKGARGSTALIGAADAELEITDSGDGAREARVTKMKDGADGDRYGFKLVPVKVGEDEDGADVVSCVIEDAEVRPMARRAAPKGKEGQWDRVISETVADLMGLDEVSVDYNAVAETAGARIPGKSGRLTAMKGLDSLVARGLMAYAGGRIAPSVGAA